MSPYRVVPRGGTFPEPDPFPTIACIDCGARTVSMCGEDLCARCDLKWLLRGIDWDLRGVRLLRGGWRL